MKVRKQSGSLSSWTAEVAEAAAATTTHNNKSAIEK